MVTTAAHHLGWATRRVDGRLLSGRGRYVGNVDLDGQLWMGVVRSHAAHGRITRVDTASAAAAAGITAVLTGADLDVMPLIPGRPGLFPASMDPLKQPVLATDRVRYVGEPVAVVVGEDPYAVEEALEQVTIVLDPLDVVTDVDDREGGKLWEGLSNNEVFSVAAVHGDAAAAMSTADVVVSATFDLPRQTGLPMECRGLVAQWQDDGQTLHLWGPTKVVNFTRASLAAMFDIERSAVICHGVDVGGMFGVRGELYPEDFLVPWAARVTGRPVKWIEDRREHMVAINHSRQQRHRVALAVNSDGTLVAMSDRVLMDIGAYPRPTGTLMGALCLRAMPGPYRWQALDLRCRAIATNKTPVGTMRGPSIVEATFVRERMIDLAAGRLGIDPVELRRRNLLTSRDQPWAIDLGSALGQLAYDGENHLELFDQFLTRVGYDGIQQSVTARKAAGEQCGLGVACFVEGTGSGMHESATLQLVEDGQFTVSALGVEIGQGLTDTVAQLASACLSVPVDRIDVSLGDSTAHEDGVGTYSSRSTMFLAGAIRDGADQLLLAARERAAALLDAPLDDVVAGRMGLTWGDELVHWKDVAPLTARGTHHQPVPTYGFGAHLAVVRVDAETHEPHVESLSVGYDCGDVVDPPAAGGQLVGAAVQGLGGALFESITYDADGQPTSTTLMDYVLPTHSEVGAVTSHLLAPPDRPEGLRMRGAGEAGIAGVGGAIGNAVAAALGRRGGAITALPITPSRIHELLDSADEPLRPRPPPPQDAMRSHRHGGELIMGGLVFGAAAAWLLHRRLTARRKT